MKTWALVALLAATAVAGCGAKDTTFTCPDGSVVDTATASGSDVSGFTAAGLCPQPVAPSVHLGASSYMVALYRPLTFTWSVDNGTYSGGHSMLTSVRMSHHPVPASDLRGPDSYGQELVRMEHQDLPNSFNATTAAGAFGTPGTFYLRAYALVRGAGLNDTNFWSPEVPINVTAVQPTGGSLVVTHGAGDFQGGLDPGSATVRIGDDLVFKNDDLRDHTFHFKSGPKGVAFDDTVAPSMGSAGPIPIRVPGAYTWTTDDLVMPLTFELSATVGP